MKNKLQLIKTEEDTKIDPKNFLVRLTIELGPGAKLDGEPSQGDICEMCSKHADDNGELVHTLMAFLNDFYQASFEAGGERSAKAPSQLQFTYGNCGECNSGTVVHPFKGRWLSGPDGRIWCNVC